MKLQALATVVPPHSEPGDLTVTRGTKVLLPDGSELKGVTRIELVGAVNDVWRARISCMVNMQPIRGAALHIVEAKPLSWWRRLLLVLAGVSSADVTTLADDEFMRAAPIRVRGSRNAVESTDTSNTEADDPGARDGGIGPSVDASAANEQPSVAEDPRAASAA
jgi:hypothetical protein